MQDLRSQLATSFGAYSIERELGGGGMARVFLAMDKALNRPVVIKVLTPELAANVSTKRFEREIRLAATLQHANIVPVLSAGATDGMPHYTMPYVEGPSLRDLLKREGRLGVPQTLSILRDVGRALAYAHERGVVHRDIKPENVLLSGDAAVVTDFGIAKAIANARQAGDDEATTPRESTVTQIGSAVGTPAYMSPEQISADPDVDHRTDIYAFGCIAYEMLSGRPPFDGRAVPALFAAHLTEQPVPLGEKRPDTPPAVARTVMQCLEKDPDKRPASARQIIGALEGAAPASGVERLVQGLTRRQRIGVAVAAAVTLVVTGGWVWRSSIQARDEVTAVAVVPFANVGRDTTDEYLSDGIADDLATALGKIRGIRVVSRSASRYYKSRRDVSARDIGSALSASHVLQGSLRHVGNRLRVSVQLVSANDDREVWSSTYDRATADAFMLQDDITRSILDELRGRLAGGAPAAPPTSISGTSNADAYDLYLRGRFLLQRRGRGVRQASENFARAFALDSNFARAYAAYAFSLELMAYFEPVRTDSMGALAVPAAQRALALDSTNAEAHSALALAYGHAYDWRNAEEQHRLAVTLEPNESENHIQFGRFLHYTGRPRDAEREFALARKLDPFSAVASGWLAHMYDLRGRHTEALVEARRAVEIDSTVAPTLFMMVQAQQSAGHIDSAKMFAEALWRRVPLPLWRAGTASLLASLGDPTRARAFLQAWEAQKSPVAQFYTIPAMVYVGLGDSASVFRLLELATKNREPWPTWYSLSEPYFDPFRKSARFRAIVRSVGLDDGVFGSPTGGRVQ